MPKATRCPKCRKNPRRGPGLNCNPCEAAWKRKRRASKRASKETPRFARKLKGTKRYIITAAQNNTPVNAQFFEALKVAAAHMGAELVVVPYRYKNPTGFAPGADLRDDEEGKLWWDPAVVPHLFNLRKKLNANLVLAADVKIQPTARSPLTGFESLTGAESCIIASPKLQFRTVPVPSGEYPKILTTTGACTVKNYSNTKAGAIGEFHYTLGACLVEIAGGFFHLRQLLGDKRDGSFTDLDKHYTEGGVTPAPPALGLVMGDTHVSITDPGVDAATFGKGGMVDVLQPRALVFHDLFNGETVNPHEEHDPFLGAARRKEGRADIQAELQQMVDFVNARAGAREVVLVDSNHHDFLRRWVVKCFANGCRDTKNARVYLESAIYMLDTARMTPGGAEYGDPFPYWVKRLGAKENIRCLKPDESFKLGEIECALHGHQGPNGARGSIKNLSRLGTKTAIGHGHSPGIEDGCWQTGTSTPRKQSYHRGPGSNLNTHIVTYATGKRCLLTVIGADWRLPA